VFEEFASKFKHEQVDHAKDLQEYRVLRREFKEKIHPRPLMPFPEDPERKKREEEERKAEELKRLEEEKKAHELHLQ